VTRAPSVALVLWLLTGCALFGVPAAEVAEIPPDNLIANPDGPVVLVDAGSVEDSDWTVHAFVSGDQVCISSRYPPFGEGGGCGPSPAAGQFGPVDLYPQSESVALVVGIVSNEVASVAFDYGNGQLEDVALVSLERAGIDAYGYVMAVGVDRLPQRVMAIDEAGKTSAELVITGQ
jgi:hypothetical protein